MTIMHFISIIAIIAIIAITAIISDCFLVGWLESVGSRVVYELDYPVRRSHSESEYPGRTSLGA